MKPETAERRWTTLPAALLVAVASGQLLLAHTVGISAWKGGGFGMFATLDARPFRHVRVFVTAPQRSEELEIPPSLEDLAASAETLPSDGQLEQLGRAVVAREHRKGRPVADVRLEVWRVEFAPGSLAPRDGLVRAYTVHAAP